MEEHFDPSKLCWFCLNNHSVSYSLCYWFDFHYRFRCKSFCSTCENAVRILRLIFVLQSFQTLVFWLVEVGCMVVSFIFIFICSAGCRCCEDEVRVINFLAWYCTIHIFHYLWWRIQGIRLDDFVSSCNLPQHNISFSTGSEWRIVMKDFHVSNKNTIIFVSLIVWLM